MKLTVSVLHEIDRRSGKNNQANAVGPARSGRGRKSTQLVIWCLALLAGCSVGRAKAQAFTGHVADQTGASIPKVSIIVHNLATNNEITATTTGAGDYTVPYLKPGPYRISASASGFETTVRTGLHLEVGQTATVNFALKLGAASETVTVQGDALIDFAKADAGEVV